MHEVDLLVTGSFLFVCILDFKRHRISEFVSASVDGIQLLHKAKDPLIPLSGVQALHYCKAFMWKWWNKSVKIWIDKFLKVYHTTGSIKWRPGSGRISKITVEIKELVEQQMQQDDETTAYHPACWWWFWRCDKCIIQLQNHRRFCYRKHGQQPKPKPW